MSLKNLGVCNRISTAHSGTTGLKIESTGTLLTLHSAISHLTHFCSVIPNTVHVDNCPLFDIDPPEFPEGWHFSTGPREPYLGPYGSKVTLPRALPLLLEERTFSVPMVYKSIISAHRHSVFAAHKALYEKGLLNDNLLPMTSVVEPEREEEVKAMLADVERREGFARISLSMDPWSAAPVDAGAEVWHAVQIDIAGLAPLWIFTQSPLIALDYHDGLTLYLPGGLPPLTMAVHYHYVGPFAADTKQSRARIPDARQWTRARHIGQGRPFRFVRRRSELLDEEEEERFHEKYNSNPEAVVIAYPLLEVEAYPWCNFLVPIRPKARAADDEAAAAPQAPQHIHLLPSSRALYLSPIAITASSSGEQRNYQRLETLGDTVLKFVCGVNVLAEYPLWHEGYLTRKKDHAVSNIRLAKENLKWGVYQWIIRNIMLGKKWKPKDLSVKAQERVTIDSRARRKGYIGSASPACRTDCCAQEGLRKKKKAKKCSRTSWNPSSAQRTCTDLAAECIKFFDLGVKWEPLPNHITQLLQHVDTISTDNFMVPPQLSDRMEFLGNSVLDMIVMDMLYHAPGKNYSPGHMHLRKSAVVNAHILSYFCLKMTTTVEAVMPRLDAYGAIEVSTDEQEISLFGNASLKWHTDIKGSLMAGICAYTVPIVPPNVDPRPRFALEHQAELTLVAVAVAILRKCTRRRPFAAPFVHHWAASVRRDHRVCGRRRCVVRVRRWPVRRATATTRVVSSKVDAAWTRLHPQAILLI
ncbi:hypothetical protein HYPSUDRAFT_1074175 [Hypholoma sublateritium FD-334 SS-4]|uniref:RNase III domain-containing protein n=1 Tax=Hypholoma sublateritium (strain FD-334 SS-4) TaxID=945553 RepID=A0A0D2P053_HYPSF|nr:hypothetical protein HYPSUDRAFT_1074175 [Hypholoma sublateritium FD-334 SS-4]